MDRVLQHRVAAAREADNLLNAKMRTLGTRLARLALDVAHPREQVAGEFCPTLSYDGARWSAWGQCKARPRPRRVIRGYGATARTALDDMAYQLDRFERGERDGEQ